MTTVPDSDLRIRAWLRGEPAGAGPSETLVDGVVARLHGTSPRPLPVVAATRPSSVLLPPPRRSLAAPALIAALLALTLIASAVASGAIRWLGDRPQPLPSPIAVRSEAPGPSEPLRTPPASPGPFRPHMAELGAIGVRLWIPDEQFADPVVGANGVARVFITSFPGDVQEITFAGKAGGSEAILAFGATERRIACGPPGRMADEVVTSQGWTDSHRQTITVDGLEAMRVQATVDGVVRVVVAVERADGCLLITSDMRLRAAMAALDIPAGDGGVAAFDQVLAGVIVVRDDGSEGVEPSATPFANHMVDLQALGIRVFMDMPGVIDPNLTGVRVARMSIPLGFFGSQRISLSAGDATSGAVLTVSGRQSSIPCADGDSMAAAVEADLLMQDLEHESVTVSGLPATWIQDRVNGLTRVIVTLPTPRGCLIVTSVAPITPATPVLGLAAGDGGVSALRHLLERIVVVRPDPPATPAPSPVLTTVETTQGFSVAFAGHQPNFAGTLGRGTGWTFGFGQGTSDLWARYVFVMIGTATDGPNGLPPVEPATLDRLRALYEASVPNPQHPVRIEVDGDPALYYHGRGAVVLVVHGGRAYLIAAAGNGLFASSGLEADIDAVLAHWNWTD